MTELLQSGRVVTAQTVEQLEQENEELCRRLEEAEDALLAIRAGNMVRVKDTGIGIPAEKLQSVFEIFTQVDRSLKRSQSGLGIGLTLVRRLVKMHGGRVEARSEARASAAS